MPSPFPGMNPYFEHPRLWEDFHHSFITYARTVIAPQVGPKYLVRIQERVYLHEPEEDERASLRIPDVTVTRPRTKPTKARGGTATLAAPAQVTLPELVKMRIGYLEVVLSEDERVVTAIELLSRPNKAPGENRDSYLTKRKELLTSGVNFVELDLLRAGPRMPMKDLPTCDYYALVFRPAMKPKADVWPLRLQDELPTIPIPVSPGDPEAKLDLKAVIDRFHDESGLESNFYRREPDPPLSPADAAWAKGLIPKRLTAPG